MDTRGGKRIGSGRKAMDPEKKRVPVCISVSPETKLMIAQMRARGIRIGIDLDKLVLEKFSRLEIDK